MTHKRSEKARQETLRRRAVRRIKRQDTSTLAGCDTYLNLSDVTR